MLKNKKNRIKTSLKIFLSIFLNFLTITLLPYTTKEGVYSLGFPLKQGIYRAYAYPNEELTIFNLKKIFFDIEYYPIVTIINIVIYYIFILVIESLINKLIIRLKSVNKM